MINTNTCAVVALNLDTGLYFAPPRYDNMSAYASAIKYFNSLSVRFYPSACAIANLDRARALFGVKNDLCLIAFRENKGL